MPIKNARDVAARAAAEALARRQAGVLSSAQSRGVGLSQAAMRRLVDRGDWLRLHRGVYRVDHEPIELSTRMWAAHLLLAGKGVVAGRAAGHYWDLIDGDLAPVQPVLMLVAEPMHLRSQGVLIRRVRDPHGWAHPARVPPVLSVENAVLDLVAAATTSSGVVEVVLRACRQRLTTPDRIAAAASQRRRLRNRGLLAALCAQARRGVTSPLERHYLTKVARAHGLPEGRLQVRDSSIAGAVTYRDVQYDAQRVVVELDGRLGHESESEVFRDQYRDNAATLSGWATLRFGWLAVVGDACGVAQQAVELLSQRGWRGRPRACGPGCTLAVVRTLGTGRRAS